MNFKKYIMLFIILLLFGCNVKEEKHNRIELLCGGPDSATETIAYKDGYDYKFMVSGSNWIIFNDEKLHVSDAIEKGYVTLDEVIAMAKQKDNCQIVKFNINNLKDHQVIVGNR